MPDKLGRVGESRKRVPGQFIGLSRHKQTESIIVRLGLPDVETRLSLAGHRYAAPPTFNRLDTSFGAKRERSADHAKIMIAQPAEESAKQWRPL